MSPTINEVVNLVRDETDPTPVPVLRFTYSHEPQASGIPARFSSPDTPASRAVGLPSGCCRWAPKSVASRSIRPPIPASIACSPLTASSAPFAEIFATLPRSKRPCATSLPEVVIHLAAQPLVRLSYQSPVETYAINVLGTVHLLDAVRRTPSVRAVVVVTSDKCYENQEWHWPYREHEPMGGHDPYSSSKGCAELVTAAYRRSFFHPPAVPGVTVARRLRTRRKRHRRWRLGARIAWFRTSCEPFPPVSRYSSATPRRCVRGSTCWSRLPDI